MLQELVQLVGAFDALGPDDVLVVEARGERGTGTVGDILALRAQVINENW